MMFARFAIRVALSLSTVVVAAVGIGIGGCGEGEGEICFEPAGLPSYVGHPGRAGGGGLESFVGCGGTAPTPDFPAAGLCEDACIATTACGLGDFDSCVVSCQGAPGCAEGFRCLRDTDCEEQLDVCSDLFEGCQ